LPKAHYPVSAEGSQIRPGLVKNTHRGRISFYRGSSSKHVLRLKRKQAGTDLLGFGVDSPGVDHLGSVLNEALDLAGGEKVLDGRSGEGATNLHTIGDDGGGDHLVVGNLLHDLVVGGLIEDASIGELVSDLSLGPLLLRLLSSSRGSLRLRVLRLLWRFGHFYSRFTSLLDNRNFHLSWQF